MPVLAPLGDFAGIDRSLVITTWIAAGGWLRLILPINAILIAGLALAKVGFDQYVRFILPLMGILLVIILAVLLLGVGALSQSDGTHLRLTGASWPRTGT